MEGSRHNHIERNIGEVGDDWRASWQVDRTDSAKTQNGRKSGEESNHHQLVILDVGFSLSHNSCRCRGTAALCRFSESRVTVPCGLGRPRWSRDSRTDWVPSH